MSTLSSVAQARRSTWVFLALATIYYGVFIALTSFEVRGVRYFSLFDDAMISLRYAWNFSHGRGLVWNTGEYVEGYSNPLWVVLLSGITAALDQRWSVFGVQLLGFFLLFLNGHLAALVGQRLSVDADSTTKELAVATAAITMLFYPLIFLSLQGMETGLCTTLLLLLFLSCTASDSSTRWAEQGLLAGLCYLCRPDGVTPAVLLLLFGSRDSTRRAVPALKRYGALALLGIVVAMHLWFRYSYYGTFVPNTYVLKIGGIPFMERIINGTLYTFWELLDHWLLLSAAASTLLHKPTREQCLAGLIVLSSLVQQVLVGGDSWFLWRFITPAAPFLIALALPTVFSVGAKLTGRDAASNLFRARVAALVIFVSNLSFILNGGMLLVERPLYVEDNAQNAEIGITLDQILAPDAKIAVIWAGAIPYFSNRYAVDLLGKCNPQVATLPPHPLTSSLVNQYGLRYVPGHNKYDLLRSVDATDPDYLQATRWEENDVGAGVRARYKECTIFNVKLILKKDSPRVLWGRDLVCRESYRDRKES